MQIKKILPALLLMFFPFLVKSQSGMVDVDHYVFQLTLTDASDTIRGMASIHLRFLKPTDQFTLDLKKTEQGKGMQVIRMEGSHLDNFVHTGHQLKVRLDKTFQAGDSAVYHVQYKGIPADGLIISQNKYGNRTFFSDNWPNRAHNWLPCIDDVADKASVEFAITAPGHYQVISNGLQVEETNLPGGQKLTRYQEKIPLPTKIMVIGVAAFAVELAGMANKVPVYSWVYPENKTDGFYDYAIAADVLEWFQQHVGAFAYPKLANVQSKTIFGGMENAGAIFYSESSVKGDRSAEALIAHEIAHQWFGNMATEKSFSHLWLSEGFATYLTTLYMENKYGLDTAMHMRKEDRQQVVNFSRRSNLPVVDTSTKNYMQLLNANSYQKGGWVLHMLRRELGDSLFWQSVRKYYKEFAGKNADSHDLQQLFEKLSGKNLSDFFRQWLFQPGQPAIRLEWEYHATRKTLELDIIQEQELPYTFPLEIGIRTRQGTTLHQLEIKEGRQSFQIPVASAPQEVIPDPGVHLLATFQSGKRTDR